MVFNVAACETVADIGPFHTPVVSPSLYFVVWITSAAKLCSLNMNAATS
jgi:hypothetical protein